VELPPGVRLFLLETRIPGVLATIGKSGGPVTSAVWYALEGDQIIISTPARGTKANRVHENARVSFVVDTKERPYRGVAIEGIAAVVADPHLAGWMTIAARYLGTDIPKGVTERVLSAPRAVIAITPLRARPWNLESAPR
jgi:PPOX class probable F420-dependent enzyme